MRNCQLAREKNPYPSWLWVRIFLSLNGLQSLVSGLVSLVVSLHLYHQCHSPALMANALFCFMAPKIYLSFAAGVVVDRLGAFLILGISLIGILGVSLTAAFWVGDGSGISLAVSVYFLNGALGLLAAFYENALLVLVPLLVSKNHYTRVYSWMEFFNSSSLLLAPVLGPIIFTFLSLKNLFFLQAIASLSIFLWIFRSHCLTFQKSPQNRQRLPSLELFPWLWRDPFLGVLLRYFCVGNLLNGLGAGLITAYVLECTGEDVGSIAALGIGTAIATLLGSSLNFFVSRYPPLQFIFWAGLGGAVWGRVFFGSATSLGFLVLWGSLRVFLVPIMNTANQVLWTEKTEEQNRGRIFGVRRLIAQGFYPLAILLGGMLYSGLQKVFSSQLGRFFILLGCCEILLSLWFWKKMLSRPVLK